MPKDDNEDKPKARLTVRQAREAQAAVAAIPKLSLKQLREAINQVPDIQATRVVQLHQRIMASEYKIDLDRLTDKLLALESDLSQD